MIGPAFHCVEDSSRTTNTSCFPGEHSRLLDLVASLLADMEPDDCKCGQQGPNHRIATHLRHCLATYQAFFDGIGNRRIDYESKPSLRHGDACGDVFDQVLNLHTRMVQEAAPLPPCTRLLVRRCDGWMESSVARESAWLEDHSIHHCMSVAMMMHPISPELARLCAKEFALED